MTDTRSSALFKRAEQLKRWEESDTNKQSTVPKRSSRVQFSPGIVFLAACAAGDKEEVQKLLHKGADINTPNVDGMTALHQACIDDNMDMVEFLVNNGADVNRGDNEGWTPLHATASCGFKSIARYLIENGANVEAVNHDGELTVDIAETEAMGDMLQKFIEEKGINCEKARNVEADSLLEDARKWAANGYLDVRDPKTGGTPLHVAVAKGYLQVAEILLEECHMEPDCLDDDGWTPLHAASLWAQKDAISLLLKCGADPLKKNYSGQTCADLVDPSIANWLTETLANNRFNNNNDRRKPITSKGDRSQLKSIQAIGQTEPIVNDKQPLAAPEIIKLADGNPPKARAPSPEVENPPAVDEGPSWRRSASFRRQPESPRENNKPSNAVDNDTILRRTHSFENDKTFYQRYRDVTARIKATSCPSIPPLPQMPEKKKEATNNTTETNKDVQTRLNSTERKDRDANTWSPSTTGSVTSPTNTTTQTTVRSSAENESNSSNSTPSAATPTKLSPGNIFKNFFKSFVPPVRDEESETQRKAHAKRVRETRRSTQGVTLDEIKSAEQLVKKKAGNGTLEAPSPASVKKTEGILPPGTTARKSGEVAVTLALASASATATATIAANSERRPSWRLRLDPANKFELEDASFTQNADATLTLPLRRPPAGSTANTTNAHSTNKEESDKKDDRESSIETKSSSNASPGSTQAALNLIQRRRRPKRRSTGFGNVDMDEINLAGNSKEDGYMDTSTNLPANNTEGELPLHANIEKAIYKSGNGSSKVNTDGTQSGSERTEEEEQDYKMLYEVSEKELRRLRTLLATSEHQLRDARATITRLTQVNQNPLTEFDKREKRALARKLSEMEEELKLHQALQAENQRLKDENGALIRVISKLSK